MRKILIIKTFLLFLIYISCNQTPEVKPPVKKLPPKLSAKSCIFYDEDLSVDKISGTLTITRADDEKDIISYIVYWGISATEKSQENFLDDMTADGTDKTVIFENNTIIPEGVSHFLIYSKNKIGESETPLAYEIDDRYLKKITTFNKSTGSNPLNFVKTDNIIYFISEEPETGVELWQLNSNDEVSIVKDINPGPSNSLINDIVLFNNEIFFHAFNGNFYNLWRTDSATNTALAIDTGLPSHFSPSDMTLFNNNIFLAGTDSSYDREIWIYNGTQLSRFTNLNNSEPSNPEYFTELNSNTLLFSADIDGNGKELCKTDGTIPGTVLIKDIIDGFIGSYPSNLIKCNTRVIFTAFSPNYGIELWSTDGTESGTLMIKDIRNGTNSSLPKDFYYYNGFVYFTADDGISGRQLWKTDGTESGTQMISGINNTTSCNASNFFGYKNSLYFNATNGTNGNELWRSSSLDSTADMIADINQTGDSNPSSFCIYSDYLYFTAKSSSGKNEIWVTNGIDTKKIIDVNLELFDIIKGSLFVFNNMLYFNDDNGESSNIYVYKSNTDL